MKNLLLTLLSLLIISCQYEAGRVFTHRSMIEITEEKNGIVPNNSSIDFDEVEAGYRKTITFDLNNRGDRDLNIFTIGITNLYDDKENTFTIEKNISKTIIEGYKKTSFTVSFFPKSKKKYAALLKITSSSAENNTLYINLHGSGFTHPVPKISLTNNNTIYSNLGSFWFDNKNPDNIQSKTFYITNNSEKTINLKRITISKNINFKLNTSKTSLILNSGEVTSFQVEYTPTSFSPGCTSIFIEENGQDSRKFTFFIGGLKSRPDIKISENNQNITTDQMLDFGTTSISEIVTREFTIENSGTEELHIYSISFGEYVPWILDNQNTRYKLFPGEKTTFTIKFSPLKRGRFNKKIIINSNSLDNGEFKINLNGATYDTSQPAILLKQNDLTIETDSIYWFNDTPINNGSSEKFIIKNIGNGILKINSVSISNTTDFHILSTPTELIPDTEAGLQIYFRPDSSGVKSAVISLHSNDPVHNIFRFTVKGESPPSPVVEIYEKISGLLTNNASLQYAPQNGIGNSTHVMSIKIINRSKTPINIENIFLSGGENSSNFSLKTENMYHSTEPTRYFLFENEETSFEVWFTNPANGGKISTTTNSVLNFKNLNSFSISITAKF